MSKILRESKWTSQLIDNLLLLARADSDDEVLKPGPVQLNAVLREAVDRTGQLASSKKLRIATDIDESELYVSGDLTLLQRLFFVLIENGVKYTPENGTVSVALRSSLDDAVIEVFDTGIGIAEEDLPHVFDRFWRADKVRSREMGGTGLGLSIAKWIVEKIGGSIQVESMLGRGSKFIVRLPKIQHVEDRVPSEN
jgi:signal transduction histidine kinase